MHGRLVVLACAAMLAATAVRPTDARGEPVALVHADEQPRLLGRWSVAFSAGMPQLGAIAVGRTIGRDWRIVGEAGTLYGMVLSGVVRADRYLRRLGPLTLFATATASWMYVTGMSWADQGSSGADKGVGLGLGVEYQFGFGMTMSAGGGVMVGEWDDSYGAEHRFVPEMTLYRIGYAW